MASPDNGVEAVEARMSRHMLALGVPLAAVAVAVSTIIAGSAGFWSSLIAVLIVLVNLGLVGYLISKASASSPVAAMATALASFFVMLVALTIFVVLFHRSHWMNLRIFGISMIALHLVLVGVEARKVSGRLAFSGFYPTKKELN